MGRRSDKASAAWVVESWDGLIVIQSWAELSIERDLALLLYCLLGTKLLLKLSLYGPILLEFRINYCLRFSWHFGDWWCWITRGVVLWTSCVVRNLRVLLLVWWVSGDGFVRTSTGTATAKRFGAESAIANTAATRKELMMWEMVLLISWLVSRVAALGVVYHGVEGRH